MSHVFDWSDSDDEEMQMALERSRLSQQRRSQQRRQESMDRALALSMMEDGLEDYEVEERLRPIEPRAAAAAPLVRVPRAAASVASVASVASRVPRCKDFQNRDMMKKALDKPPKVSYKVADTRDELCRKLIASGRAQRDNEPSPLREVRREAVQRAQAAAVERQLEPHLRGQGALPRLQVKVVDRIPNENCYYVMEPDTRAYEPEIFQFVYGTLDARGTFIVNPGNNSACLDRESITYMMNDRDDRGNYLNWFYECTGRAEQFGRNNTGDEVFVKLALGDYTVYTPKPLLDSMLANNIYRVGLVPHRTVTRSAKYVFARGNPLGYQAGFERNDFVSANHCQDGSKIIIYDLVALREREGERRDAGTRRRTIRNHRNRKIRRTKRV
jgi:hypothetical protein